MLKGEAVDVVVAVMAPKIGDTMAVAPPRPTRLGVDSDSSMSPDRLEALLGKLLGGLNIFPGCERAVAVVAQAREALAARGEI
jgi:hypothetical protein